MIIILPIFFPLVTRSRIRPGVVRDLHGGLAGDGFITPPMGLSLFVIQGLARGRTMRDITYGTALFVVLTVLEVVLLVLMPDLALWLPRRLWPAIEA